jgi:hypothetical protein
VTDHDEPVPHTLMDVLARIGLDDGFGHAVSSNTLRIQCPECDRYIVIADATATTRDGVTVYMCPDDQEQFVSVGGERQFSFYGASEVLRSGVWHPWDILNARRHADRETE